MRLRVVLLRADLGRLCKVVLEFSPVEFVSNNLALVLKFA